MKADEYFKFSTGCELNEIKQFKVGRCFDLIQEYADHQNKETLSLLDEMAEALEYSYSVINDVNSSFNIVVSNNKTRSALQKHKTLKDVQK